MFANIMVPENISDEGNAKQQPDDTGEKAGNNQQDCGNDQHRTMDERPIGDVSGSSFAFDLLQKVKTLKSCNGQTGYGAEQDEGDRWKYTDTATDDYKSGNLDERNEKKSDQ